MLHSNTRKNAPSLLSVQPSSLSRRTTTSSKIGQLLVSLVRMIMAMILGVLLSPVVAPAVFIRLPDCALVRMAQRIAAVAINHVASVAGVRALVGAKCDVVDDEDLDMSWLPAPIVRAWESPLPRGRVVKTLDQPGRWMTDNELDELRELLIEVAKGSMEVVPHHRLFDPEESRQVYSNRIISIGFSAEGEPIGFTAMVYLPYPGDVLLHLGLTMIAMKARRTRMQSPLFVKCLSLATFNMCRISFTITNIAASPAGIGSVCDYFLDAFPHYLGIVQRSDRHLAIADHVLTFFRHEFGCSENAVFDPVSFVVRGSNEPDGGGSSAFIKEDGKPVSQHKNPKCNEFVVNMIDLTAGDELFQVARFDLSGALWAYFMKHAGWKKAIGATPSSPEASTKKH